MYESRHTVISPTGYYWTLGACGIPSVAEAVPAQDEAVTAEWVHAVLGNYSGDIVGLGRGRERIREEEEE